MQQLLFLLPFYQLFPKHRFLVTAPAAAPVSRHIKKVILNNHPSGRKSTPFSGFTISCIFAILYIIARQPSYIFFLNVNYIKSLIAADNWLKLFLQQFYNHILQWLSSSDRNILVTKIYAPITKTKKRLFNIKHKITNVLMIFRELNFPFIPQYNTLTL